MLIAAPKLEVFYIWARIFGKKVSRKLQASLRMDRIDGGLQSYLPWRCFATTTESQFLGNGGMLDVALGFFKMLQIKLIILIKKGGGVVWSIV